jgi:hypothetical protein
VSASGRQGCRAPARHFAIPATLLLHRTGNRAVMDRGWFVLVGLLARLFRLGTLASGA